MHNNWRINIYPPNSGGGLNAQHVSGTQVPIFRGWKTIHSTKRAYNKGEKTYLQVGGETLILFL